MYRCADGCPIKLSIKLPPYPSNQWSCYREQIAGHCRAGGISPAGRSSGFHGYHRLVFDQLSARQQQQTLTAIARLRGLADDAPADSLLSGTLIRQLETNLFDNNAPYYHRPLKAAEGSELVLPKRRLPRPLPENWQVEELADGRNVRVRFCGVQSLMLPSTRAGSVNAAGQLPSGFDPADLYQSRNHPGHWP